MAEDKGFHPVRTLVVFARQSPWVLIAVALHLIVIAGAAILYTSHGETEVADNDPRIRPRGPEERIEPLALPEPDDTRNLIPENPTADRLDDEQYYVDLSSTNPEPLGDPDAPDRPTELAPANTAIGVGIVGEGGHKPNPIRGPGKEFKPGRGDPTGGGPDGTRFEKMLAGLRWLARHQNEDGSWSQATLSTVCPCDHPAYEPPKANARAFDTGLTALALLAYLGAGYSHESKQSFQDPVTGRRFVTGQIVKNGLKWLLDQQGDDGSFTPNQPFLYNEALCAMALSEAYGLTQSRYWKAPAQLALDFVQAAQRPSPLGNGLWGWRYASRQEVERFHRGQTGLEPAALRELCDADASVTGWCVMALKSGELSGLNVQRTSMQGAVDFARFVTQVGGDGKPTGLAGYLDAKGAGAKVTGPNDHFVYHPASMSALAMCIRIFGEHDPEDPFLRAGAEKIAQDLPRPGKDGLSIDYYYWYYASLALNQVDGPDAPKRTGKWWPAWDKALFASLEELQVRGKGDCTEGGWMAPDRWGIDHGGPLYATALNTLTLEVYHRYPNALGGGKRN